MAPSRRRPLSPKIVGAVVRTLRIQAGLTQDVMGQRAGIGRSYLGGIERGTRRPSIEKIDQLLAALDASWVDFAATLERVQSKGSRSRPGASRSPVATLPSVTPSRRPQDASGTPTRLAEGRPERDVERG
jgi:transcriptional regulator with XRE-family HTH domain